jgi:hypothetical protein
MPESDVLAQWLGDRSFYAGLILVLLAIGLLLALARRHRSRGGSAPRPAQGGKRTRHRRTLR